MAWAVLAKNEHYRPPMLVGALPQDWPADDAWLRPGLEIAFAIPTSTDQRLLTELMIFCQVCWRTMRWHNGRTRRSRNL